MDELIDNIIEIVNNTTNDYDAKDELKDYLDGKIYFNEDI